MKLQLGATAFFTNPKDFQQVLQVIQKFPFLSYLEFRGEHPFFFPDVTPAENFQFYRKILQQTHLKTTIHTTMYDINLATLNPWLKNANLQCYKKFIDLAAFFEAEIVVVHDGHLPREFVESPAKDKFLEMATQNLKETLYELAEYGRQKGVKIALENAPPKSDYALVWNAENQSQILQELNHPYLGALVDIAHASLHGLDVLTYLKEMKPWLMEIHAHNNNGELDDHLGLPTGIIDYKTILQNPVVNNIPFIMEIKSYDMLLETLIWLQKSGLVG